MGLEGPLRDYNAACPANRADISLDDGGITVFPSGAFDLASSQALLDLLSYAVDEAMPGISFFVNLARVTYLPSTAIGALSTAMVKAQRKGVVFAVRDVPEPIAKIIKLLGFWEYFHVS
jgi:anti-anti-sigma factor